MATAKQLAMAEGHIVHCYAKMGQQQQALTEQSARIVNLYEKLEASDRRVQELSGPPRAVPIGNEPDGTPEPDGGGELVDGGTCEPMPESDMRGGGPSRRRRD